MADFVSSNPLIESVHDEEVHSSAEDLSGVQLLPLITEARDSNASPNSLTRGSSQRHHTTPLLDYFRHVHRHGLSTEAIKQLEEADQLLRRGKHAEAISCLELSLLTSNPDSSLQSLLWRLLGNAHLSLGQYKKASICFLHHLAFCRELNDFDGVTKAECNLGISYMKLGMLKLAGRCFLQYLENSRVLQDNMGVAKALSNLGVLSKTLAARAYEAATNDDNLSKENADANLKRAITYFEQHLEIVEQYGDLEKQARAYGNLGSCHEMARQYPQAMFCHSKRLEIARMTSDWRSECYALCNLGNCCRANSKYEEALEYYITNLELSRSMDNIAGEIASLLNLGATCELLGRVRKAIEWYTLYLSLMVQLKDHSGQARALATLASLSEDTKDINKARIYYTMLIEVFQQIGDQKAVAMATGHLRFIQKHKRQKKGAELVVNQSLENLEIEDSPMIRRGRKFIPRAHLGPRHRHQMISSLLGGSWGHPQTSLVLENHRAISAFVNRADNLYRDQNMMQLLFEQEAENSLYKLGDLVAIPHQQIKSPVIPLLASVPLFPAHSVRPEDRPLPNPPPDNHFDSNHLPLSDYATINEAVGSSDKKSHDMRRERHLQELKQMSEDFNKPLTELGIHESTDREWNQWLEIQGLIDDSTISRGGSNVEMTAFGKRGHADTRAVKSTPQSLDVL